MHYNHPRSVIDTLPSEGWKLSAAYDLNPIVGRQGLHLNITDKANGLDYGLAFEVMDFFRLTRADATRIYDEVLGCRAAGLPGSRGRVWLLA